MGKYPFNVRVLQAKAELTQSFRDIGMKYDMPGVVMDLILTGLLADERQAHMALISEQIKGERDADTRTEHESADGPGVGSV